MFVNVQWQSKSLGFMLTINGGRAGLGPTGPASNAGVAGPQSQSSVARLFQGRWAGIGPASWSRNKFFAELRDEMANFQAKRV